MPILALGVSHRRAPVELLERLAFGNDEFAKAYDHLTRTEGVRGAVIVSTCNRVEVYGDVEAYHTGFQALRAFLAESRGVDAEELADPLYSHYEEQAAEHLFSVAAGLDSMVLGEPQILSQVRQAYLRAEAELAAGPQLTALFRRAIRTGRRARAETAIGASPAAFVEAGARLAEAAIGPLAAASVVVVGAGKMSELAVRHLRERGVAGVTVLARNAAKGERLARLVGGTARTLTPEALAEALAGAGLLISATGAAGLVVHREHVGPRERPLFALDLAVPRDVDPALHDVPGVTVADIDDLRSHVDRTDDAEVEAVRTIVRDEVHRFTTWRRAQRLAPVFEQLFERAEGIRRAELDRVRARLAELSPDEREAVESATRAIVAKLLHRPVVTAKDLGEAGDARAGLLAQLFGLEEPPPA